METSNQKLLNYKEAAAYLHIQPGTLRTWVYKKRIDHIKIGSRVFFKQEMLDNFLTASTVHAERSN